MSEFQSTIDRADTLTRRWQRCEISALELEEALLREGFFCVQFSRNTVRATLAGINLQLGDKK